MNKIIQEEPIEGVIGEYAITPEQIQQDYYATMNSVTLLNDDKPEWMSDEDWVDTVSRNKEHIALMLSKTYWTTEDLTPFETAIQ